MVRWLDYLLLAAHFGETWEFDVDKYVGGLYSFFGTMRMPREKTAVSHFGSSCFEVLDGFFFVS